MAEEQENPEYLDASVSVTDTQPINRKLGPKLVPGENVVLRGREGHGFNISIGDDGFLNGITPPPGMESYPVPSERIQKAWSDGLVDAGGTRHAILPTAIDTPPTPTRESFNTELEYQKELRDHNLMWSGNHISIRDHTNRYATDVAMGLVPTRNESGEPYTHTAVNQSKRLLWHSHAVATLATQNDQGNYLKGPTGDDFEDLLNWDVHLNPDWEKHLFTWHPAVYSHYVEPIRKRIFNLISQGIRKHKGKEVHVMQVVLGISPDSPQEEIQAAMNAMIGKQILNQLLSLRKEGSSNILYNSRGLEEMARLQKDDPVEYYVRGSYSSNDESPIPNVGSAQTPGNYVRLTNRQWGRYQNAYSDYMKALEASDESPNDPKLKEDMLVARNEQLMQRSRYEQMRKQKDEILFKLQTGGAGHAGMNKADHEAVNATAHEWNSDIHSLMKTLGQTRDSQGLSRGFAEPWILIQQMEDKYGREFILPNLNRLTGHYQLNQGGSIKQAFAIIYDAYSNMTHMDENGRLQADEQLSQLFNTLVSGMINPINPGVTLTADEKNEINGKLMNSNLLKYWSALSQEMKAYTNIISSREVAEGDTQTTMGPIENMVWSRATQLFGKKGWTGSNKDYEDLVGLAVKDVEALLLNGIFLYEHKDDSTVTIVPAFDLWKDLFPNAKYTSKEADFVKDFMDWTQHLLRNNTWTGGGKLTGEVTPEYSSFHLSVIKNYIMPLMANQGIKIRKEMGGMKKGEFINMLGEANESYKLVDPSSMVYVTKGGTIPNRIHGYLQRRNTIPDNVILVKRTNVITPDGRRGDINSYELYEYPKGFGPISEEKRYIEINNNEPAAWQPVESGIKFDQKYIKSFVDEIANPKFYRGRQLMETAIRYQTLGQHSIASDMNHTIVPNWGTDQERLAGTRAFEDWQEAVRLVKEYKLKNGNKSTSDSRKLQADANEAKKRIYHAGFHSFKKGGAYFRRSPLGRNYWHIAAKNKEGEPYLFRSGQAEARNSPPHVFASVPKPTPRPHRSEYTNDLEYKKAVAKHVRMVSTEQGAPPMYLRAVQGDFKRDAFAPDQSGRPSYPSNPDVIYAPDLFRAWIQMEFADQYAQDLYDFIKWIGRPGTMGSGTPVPKYGGVNPIKSEKEHRFGDFGGSTGGPFYTEPPPTEWGGKAMEQYKKKPVRGK